MDAGQLAALMGAWADALEEAQNARWLAATWEMAALATLLPGLDTATAERVGDRIRELAGVPA